MAKVPSNAGGLTILFTCVGRRVELLRAFRAAGQRLGIPLRIIAVDQHATAPGLYCADVKVIVPPVLDPGYMPAVLDAVRRNGVTALIPTIDTDLRVISEHRDVLDALGCTAMIAPPQTIRICRDKVLTYEFLSQQGIDTPKTYLPDDVLAARRHEFPYFLKPRHGSASAWVHKIEDAVDLEYYARRVRDPIVQEFIDGVEHTLDVYVGLSGKVRCVVPRARWQVRAGEVAKGVVVKDRRVMDAGRHVVELLPAAARGVVTLQCIVTAAGRICFIEINPRFGGGAPLAVAAGADLPGWLLQELSGRDPQIAFDGFRHGLCMLRYDWSVFVPLDAKLTPALGTPLRAPPPFE